MRFKTCTCFNHPNDRCEYVSPLQTGSKFVSLYEEVKNKKVLVPGLLGKTYKEKKFVREFLRVKYPGAGPYFTDILAKDREKWVLVVNHNQRRAIPILKVLFDKNYGVGKVGQKAKGDSGLPHQEEVKSDPRADAAKISDNEREAARKGFKSHPDPTPDPA